MFRVKDFNHQQYSQNLQQYLDSNREGNIGGSTPQKRVELLKKYLPIGRVVFEIGAGEGLDSIELQKAGYKVISSDYIDKFVEILRKKGLKTIQFDAKHDKLSYSTDCIYANAVFVHFSPEEIIDFLKRVKSKITKEKVIFLSLIRGEGNERSARSRGFERDFYYYTENRLKDIVKNAGYQMLFLNNVDQKWIHAIVTGNTK